MQRGSDSKDIPSRAGKRRSINLKVISYKKHGLFISDIWFPEADWRSVHSDIIRFHSLEGEEISSSKEMQQVSVQHTPSTDLTKSMEDLYSEIRSKNFKYESRRSERGEAEIRRLFFMVILSEEVLMNQFKACFDQMFMHKGENASMNLTAMQAYAKADALLLSLAFFDGSPVVFHSYANKGNRVRFFHSCSTFRDDPQSAQFIGRVNTRLPWEDWKFLKERGVTLYNWGEVFAFDSDDGIDKFKMTFDGCPSDYYNAVISMTFAGKASLNIRKILRRGRTELSYLFLGNDYCEAEVSDVEAAA